jgi:putative lipoprotein
MRARVIGTWLVIAGLVGACAAEPAASAIRVSHPTTLTGTTWRLVAIGGAAVPTGPDVTATFGPGDVSGNGGCNSFGGAYRYDPTNGALAIGDLVSTKRACVEPLRNEVEAAALQALRTATRAEMDEAGRLVISGAGAELLLEVGPQPAGAPVPAPSSAPGPS